MPAWPVNPREVELLKIRQEIMVTVVTAEQYDPQFPTGSIQAVIKIFENILEEIPEEYRDTAQVDFESVSSYYDSHYCRMEIVYRRPETDEEWDARKADVRKRQVAYEQEILRKAAAIRDKGVIK